MSSAIDRRTSGPFCILPWVHAQIYNTGDVNPCCRARGVRYGSLRQSSFEEIWNSKEAREFRLAMFGDNPPEACWECLSDENLTGSSYRLRSNARYGFQPAEKTRSDGSVDQCPPRSLEIRFSNLCNFSCRTCDPIRSSAWNSDAKALGQIVPERAVLTATDPPEKIWEVLEPLLPVLDEILFVGGEPLLHEAHYETLERLLALGRTDIRLSYNTNFSKLSYRKWNALKLWQKFRNVHITASFDGVGAHAELIRKGTRWAEIERNFRLFRLFAPRASFNIFCTISALNCFHLPEAIDQWIELGMISEDSVFRANLLHEPRSYNLNILLKEERAELARKYRAYLATLRERVSPSLFNQVEARLNSVLSYFAGDFWETERKEFMELTSRIDQLRNENFAELFPEFRYGMLREPMAGAFEGEDDPRRSDHSIAASGCSGPVRE